VLPAVVPGRATTPWRFRGSASWMISQAVSAKTPSGRRDPRAGTRPL